MSCYPSAFHLLWGRGSEYSCSCPDHSSVLERRRRGRSAGLKFLALCSYELRCVTYGIAGPAQRVCVSHLIQLFDTTQRIHYLSWTAGLRTVLGFPSPSQLKCLHNASITYQPFAQPLHLCSSFSLSFSMPYNFLCIYPIQQIGRAHV